MQDSRNNNDLEMRFRKSHPKLYLVFTLLTCILVLAPCILAPIIRMQIFGSNSNPYWGASGVIGGIILGIGFFNIIAAVFKKGWKPWISILLLVVGGLMIAGSFMFP